MTDPKFVAFSTQKGGAGKTTLTVLAASYLYYVKGLKVLVVDCDYPQYSIEEMRERDKDLIECSPAFKKLFSDNLRLTRLGPFPLLTAKPEEAMQKVREIIEDGNDIDIVFFDLPGTVNNRGVVTTSAGISVSPALSSNQETTSSEGRMAANSPEAETDTGCKGRKPFVSSVILSSRGETLTAPSAFR